LRPEPERIQEIQQALVQAGYLIAQPNGRWDDQTRDAMRRYQADHGFPVTGLPEAKSLMKLGLGPHPLPAELDTSSGAKAGADTNGSLPTQSPTPTTSDAQQTPPPTTTPKP
jgi:peptidoglycan hydrolase-like protein with peptidoglycan-binding domain